MAPDWHGLTLSDALDALRTGEVTSVELTRRAVERADAFDGILGTFLARFVDRSLEAATQADQQLASGAPVGALHGVPMGVKDLIATAEAPATAQSVVLDPNWHRDDAEVVARLRRAGAIVAGKTTTMEFAAGLPDQDKPFPRSRNPWDLTRWSGGSSSGTANGVAAGMIFGGLGTDTAGSVRIPAAFCGITGLMPTFGLVPKSGCVPAAYTVDRIGPMARSARDCALMLGVLAGHHPPDVSSIEVPAVDYLAGLTGDLSGMTIGMDLVSGSAGQIVDPELEPALTAAAAVLQARGARVVEVSLPLHAEALAALQVISAGEALAYHRQDARSRLADYVTSNRLAMVTRTAYSAADYVQAQRVRRVVQHALKELFEQVDLVLTPSAFVAALPLDDLQLDYSWATGLNAPYWNCSGSPAISVPVGLNVDGLPLGMQLAGRPFEEATVLAAADAFQRDTNWHRRLPPLEAQVDGLVPDRTDCMTPEPPSGGPPT